MSVDRTRTSRRFLLTVVPALIVLIVGIAAAGYWLHEYLTTDVEQVDSLVAADASPNLVAVLAAPGDELAMAGTLAALESDGIRVSIPYLAESPLKPDVPLDAAGLPDLDDVAVTESESGGEPGTALGVDRVEFLSQSEDVVADMNGVAQRLAAVLAQENPSTVVGFDNSLGRDGRVEHLQAGQAMADATRAHTAAGYSIADVWHLALPQEQVDLASKTSESFKRSYPADQQARSAIVGINVLAHASERAAAAEGYMRLTVTDNLPGYGWFPLATSRVYYYLSHTEYFAPAPGSLPGSERAN